jgi:tetratricopeptide (TPR) repeat protein
MNARWLRDSNRRPALPIILLLGLIAVNCSGKHTPEQDSRLHFQQGLKYMGQGNMSQAILELKYAIHLDPDFAQPYYHLGVAYQQIGGTEDALKYLNQYLRFNPEHLDTHLRLMRIFYLTGKIEEAVEKGNYILAREPDQAEAHAVLGNIYLYKKNNPDAAAFHFKQVLKNKPNSIETYMKLVEASLRNGDQEQAQQLLTQVIALDPTNTKAYHWLAEIYTKTQKEKELMELYKKIIELEAEDLPPRINLANLYFKHQMYQQAETAAKEILKLDPLEPTAHFILGRIHLLREEYRQAVQELSIARKAKYEPAETSLHLGIAYQKLMQWDEAIDVYEDLILINPELFEAQFALTKLYLRTKQWDKAAARANDIIYRFHGFEEAYLLQGLAHVQSGDWETAEEELESFFAPENKLDEKKRRLYLKIYPNLLVPRRFKKVNPWYDTLAHYLLGICRLVKSDLSSALTEFHQAIIQHPAYADPYLAEAITYHIQGKYAQAIESCLTALRVIGNEQPLAHLILANIYTSQGDLVTAREHMRQAEGAVAEFPASQMDITKNVSERNPLSLARLNLGVFYLLYGWKGMAKTQCQLALAANPHNPLANYIVDEMYKLITQYYGRHNRLDEALDKLLEYP